VAALGVAVRVLAGWVWGPVVGGVTGVLTVTLATGAFHEDGLADAADGLWGGTEPAERLRIMRDSRLGTYATVALIALLAVKFAALAPMSIAVFAATLVPAMVLARASSLILMRALPAAPDSLATLAGAPSVGGWVVAGASVAVSLVGFGVGAWLPLILALLVTAAAGGIALRKVGGINGDQLGAANQLVEVAVLVAGVGVFDVL
jgi:adenosylcobinamide-GDP ribazoletransferase